MLDEAGCCRLLSGDADGFPGMVVDRYAKTLVLQSGCQGSDRMRDFIVELLLEALPFEPDAIVDRSDASVRKLEKLDPIVETIRGAVDGPVLARDGDLLFEVDVFQGTRRPLPRPVPNRRAAAGRRRARVLDAFSYDGLGLHAALAGPSRSCASSRTRARAAHPRQRRAQRTARPIKVERVDCMKDSAPAPSARSATSWSWSTRRPSPFEEGGGGRRALRRAQPPRSTSSPRAARSSRPRAPQRLARGLRQVHRRAANRGRDVWLES